MFHRLIAFVGSLLLILFCLPVYAFLALLVLLHSGRPVLYVGERLGRAKQPFTMFKFRTLVPNADEILAGTLVDKHSKVITPLGRFMRDTRLDELPQLFNVLLGNMDLMGPRPVRPVVYESLCSTIPGYDERFRVKPGLLGYAQLFTPHSSPKRLRAMIDIRQLAGKDRLWREAGAIALAMRAMLMTVVRRTGRMFFRDFLWWRLIGRHREKRRYERRRPRGVQVLYEVNGTAREARLVNINEEAFLMTCEETTPSPAATMFTLKIETQRFGRTKRKTAFCYGKTYEDSATAIAPEHFVILYEPISPMNQYRIHQYLLGESIV